MLTIIFCFFLSFKLCSKEQKLHLANQAQIAFFSHDYEKAIFLYQSLLKKKNASWQQAIFLYNLGTIKLAQKNGEAALDNYSFINIDKVKNPLLLRSLFFNQVLAHYRFSLQLLQPNREIILADYLCSLDQFLGSLKALEMLSQLAIFMCEIEKEEKNEAQKKIEEKKLIIDLHIHKTYLQAKQFLMEKVDLISFVFILKKDFKKLFHFLKKIEQKNLSSSLQNQYLIYLKKEAKNLQIFWQKKSKKLACLELKKLEKNYQSFIKDLEKNQIDLATKKIEEIQLKIKENFPFSKNDFSSLLIFYYQLFLIDQTKNIRVLPLLFQLQKKVAFLDVKKAAEVNHYLSLSLNFYKEKRNLMGNFFFLAAFQKIQQEEIKKIDVPKEIFSKIILQLWSLKKMTEESLSFPPFLKVEKIIKEAQQDVIELADLFFKEVLLLQIKEFEEKKLDQARCQKSPWNEFFPLFSQGKESMQLAKNLLPDFEKVLFLEKESLQYWMQALQTLYHPAKSHSFFSKNSSELPTNRSLIQEMLSQDQDSKPLVKKEGHSW